MNYKYRYLIILFVLGILVSFFLINRYIELESKKEWAALQSFYIQDKLKTKYTYDNISLYKYNKYRILMIDSKCIILLNAKYSPYIKYIGECKNIKISKKSFKYIKNNSKITKANVNFLEHLVK